MGRTVWSTTDVPEQDAADYWADVVCEAFVPVHARPRTDGFTGRIEHLTVAGTGLTALWSSAQRVERTRPYSLAFADPFAQLVVQVPRTLVPQVTTAVTLRPHGPGRLVADFFAGMRSLEPDAVASLLPHGLGLLEWAAGSAATNDAITSERVTRFVRQHADDPSLDANEVAAGCGISRRTMFRAVTGMTPAAYRGTKRQ